MTGVQTCALPICWFLDSYTARDIDEAVIRENGVLRPEVLALKRMNYIQDCFITHYDLVDQSYVDALSEDIYAKLYDDAEFQQTETTAQDDLADSNTDATENTDISGADTPPADAADIADTDTDIAATENAAMTDINMPAAGNTDMSDIHSDKSDSADTAVIADAHMKLSINCRVYKPALQRHALLHFPLDLRVVVLRFYYYIQIGRAHV